MDPSVFTVEAMAMLNGLALAAIAGYQRWISPYKGFRCAYRAHTGRCSCSQLGARAIRRFGTFDGIGVLRERLYRCGVAFRRFGKFAPPTQPAPAGPSEYSPAHNAVRVPPQQRGDCDIIACVPIDAIPCDAGIGDAMECLPSSGPSVNCSPSPCDLLQCGDCFDSPRKQTEEERQRQAMAEADVHIPPRRARP